MGRIQSNNVTFLSTQTPTTKSIPQDLQRWGYRAEESVGKRELSESTPSLHKQKSLPSMQSLVKSQPIRQPACMHGDQKDRR